MDLTLLDWSIIVGYFLLTLVIGLVFAKRAGKSLAEFFVSGRSLPWWIAGTSMVATTFAADTPLAVTGLIVKNGLAGNWFWWAFAAGGMLTVFVFARLWRRADVMTDVELISLRYSGPAAQGLRYLRSCYVALIVNPIIIGWVIGAMLTVLQQTVFFDSPVQETGAPFWNQFTLSWTAIIGMMVVVGVYSTLSGLWGVVISDVIQFGMAMAGCIWLAIVAVNHVGGIGELQAKVEANFGDQQAFNYIPQLSAGSLASEGYKFSDPDKGTKENATFVANSANAFLQEHNTLPPLIANAIRSQAENVSTAAAKIQNEESDDAVELRGNLAQLESSLRKATPGPWMLLHVFLIMLTMQWWATWYPGAEPGGGGYVVQRMASCKDERHAILATLWYQVAHYCVRPWPWIMISFVALALYPELRANYIADDSFKPEIGFPMVMRELCTPGLAGLMLVAFFAAFMSTMSTQMNWGASYMVRDFIQPLFLKAADDKKLANVSRIVSVTILLIGLLFGYLMQDISVDEAWKILAALGAGTGLVFMLRWFWWRINAWSEITAMIASLVYFSLLNVDTIQSSIFGSYKLRSEEQMALVAVLTILTWLAITLLTPAESDKTLDEFFKKIRPGGPGWKPLAKRNPEVDQDKNLGLSILGACFAAGIVYLTLPAIGYLIFGKQMLAIGCFVGAAVCGIAVQFIMKKMLSN